MERKILMIKENENILNFFLEDGEIVEIHLSEAAEETRPAALGDIYVGKVQNIVANIGAAFIDIGGINCYYDISQAEHAIFTKKAGKKTLCIGDELLVQISREAVKTKAPTVSSNISLTGRYAVLTSGNNRIGVSAKIPKSQRDEFKEKLSILKNEDFGIIVRTNAKDVSYDTLLEEIQKLEARFYHLKRTALCRTCFSCLETATKPYLTDLKNVYMDGLTEIIVEDDELYGEIEEYFEKEQPESLSLLRKYYDPMLPLAKLYSITTVMERALNQRVWLKHGGYLIIQPTEAMTVIDVNSGKCISKKSHEKTCLEINMEAAEAIAAQIRLRNLSGIIIVDFINMEEEESMQQLLTELRHHLAKDPIQTTLVDVTGLQLVEITRKKLRRPLHECRRKEWEKKN